MPEDFRAWFELRSEHGVDYAENREPIREVALTLSLPQMTPGGVIASGQQVCVIRPADELTDEMPARVIPGTRIIETSSLLTAQALYSRAEYEQLVDEPTQAQVNAAKAETAAHVDATRKRADAVARGSEHPADMNDPNPAPPPLTGAVSIPGTPGHALVADDRLAIDQGVAAGEILDDEAFAEWLAGSSIDDVVKAVGDDRLFALRALVAEELGDKPRKGLLGQLTPIAAQEG
jgi:hypothetical protein